MNCVAREPLNNAIDYNNVENPLDPQKAVKKHTSKAM